MGIFGKTENCKICGEKLKFGLIKSKCLDGYICFNCINKAGLATGATSNITPEIYQKYLDTNNNKIAINDTFKASHKISNIVEFDDANRNWRIPVRKGVNPRLYSYDDIVDFELNEDGHSVSSGGLGRAVAGGLLFGGVGAIVGGVTGGKKAKGVTTNMFINVIVRNNSATNVNLTLINRPLKKGSLLERAAQNNARDIIAKLTLITKSINDEKSLKDQNTNTISSADEIMRYKELLDKGILTQEEFDAKKKQLLGI